MSSQEAKVMTRAEAQAKLREYQDAKLAVASAYHTAMAAGDLTEEKSNM